MNISVLKKQSARLIQNGNKKEYYHILLAIILLQTIISLYTGYNQIINIICIALSILFITLKHGIIVSSLNIINKQKLNNQDIFIGIKNWTDLIGTYVLRLIIVYTLPLLIISLSSYYLISVLVSNEAISSALQDNFIQIFTAIPQISALILIILLLCFIIIFILNTLTFLMPYLKAQYNSKATDSLKTSISIMKDYFIDYILLELSFIHYHLLLVFISVILNIIIPISPIVLIITNIIMIYLYYPKYTLTKALFYNTIISEESGEYYE